MDYSASVQQTLGEVASEMGFSELKVRQVEAILVIVSGKDVISFTGYG